MQQNNLLTNLFTDAINNFISNLPQKSLYQPIEYILGLGGKKLRPQLSLISCNAFGGELNKAIPFALAVEVFHNFSLVHDDIMDEAPLRRGKPTVHKKWNNNTAILSGDAMLILVYQLLNMAEPSTIQKALDIFNQVSLEVCEGQMADMEFESTHNVTIEQYIDMIRQKTAVLLGGALQLGALAANAPTEKQQAIYNFGINLGIAFQLRDDLLDTFGNQAEVGKQVGGDILANKKTFLYLKALEVANSVQQNTLTQLYSNKTVEPNEKISQVKNIFSQLNIELFTQQQVDFYSKKALENLNECGFDQKNEQTFIDLVNFLLNRTL